MTKTDDFDSAILLAGVPFRLEDSDGIVIYDRLETDQNGRIEVAGLPPGDYRFIELEPAPHYLLDETPVDFEVVANQLETLERVKTNKLIPGTIELLKVDDRRGEPLAGAVFRLVYENGPVIYEDLVTDENGLLIIDNLRPGSYELIEVQAPAGYFLPRNNVTIVSLELADIESRDGDVQEVEIGNSRIVLSGSFFDSDLLSATTDSLGTDPDRIALPQTEGTLSIKLLLALASIMVIMGLTMKLRYI
ncbi:MAG: SpaA isopeptide-forming pilin-related protein [Bacillota bacterium]